MYLLLLQKMMKHENPSMSPARHPVRALVLAPTRELADQVAVNIKKYASKKFLKGNCCPIQFPELCMLMFLSIDCSPPMGQGVRRRLP